MTDEAQRIAIAEFCGWKAKQQILDDEWSAEHGKKITVWQGPKTGWIREKNLPNYLSDLNAIHEAENKLEPLKHYQDWNSQVCEFERELCKLVKADSSHKWAGDSFKIAHATARQRCEALLRTIGKWVES